MTKNFEYKGLWFLAADPDTKVAGTIIFKHDDGLTLDLIGSFPRNSKIKNIIWGILENGEFATLHNNFEISRTMNLPGLEIASYKVNFLFIGAHFTNEMDISFNKMCVHYAYLDEWLNIKSGFNIKHNPKEYRYSIEYKLPSPVDVNIDSNTKLSVNLVASIPTRKTQKEVTIKQKAFINFDYKRKVQFSKVLENTFHFQNFLTLTLQRPAYHKELDGYLKIKGVKGLNKVRIFFHVNHLPEIEKELHSSNMLIPYGVIADRFDLIIKDWFDKRSDMETTTDPFFSSYYNPYLYMTDKFLNLSRSIEAFHRVRAGKRDPSTGNDYIFIKRVVEIIAKFSRIFNNTLKIPNKNKFALVIKKYRNDYTHSNPILKSKDKRFIELHYLSEKLQLIITCALLSEHGLTHKEIKMRIENSSLYTHLRLKLK